MKDFFYEYFYHTRNERNGALVLIALILILGLGPRLYPVWFPPAAAGPCPAPFPEPKADAPTTESPAGAPALFPFDPNVATRQELLQLGLSGRTAAIILNYRNKGGRFYQASDLQKIYGLRQAEYERLAPYIRIAKRPPKTKAAPPSAPVYEAFPFDPNTATAEELQRLGFPGRVAATLVNFRRKGGRFSQAEDLQKIYGLDTALYRRVAPLVDIPPPAPGPLARQSRPLPQSYDAPPPPVRVDINRADSEAWQRLRGIGPGYAKRILRFREALGGFAAIDQVAETFGLPDSTFQAIRPQLSPSPIFRFLDINGAAAETLSRHPYLNRKQAQTVVSYRINHGPYRSPADLEKVKVLSRKEIDRLLPYLKFEAN